MRPHDTLYAARQVWYDEDAYALCVGIAVNCTGTGMQCKVTVNCCICDDNVDKAQQPVMVEHAGIISNTDCPEVLTSSHEFHDMLMVKRSCLTTVSMLTA